MDGPHNLETTVRVTEHVIAEVYHALHEAHVLLEGTILKTNLVCPGSSSPDQVSPQQVAHATLTVLQRTVPAAVPTINVHSFLFHFFFLFAKIFNFSTCSSFLED